MTFIALDDEPLALVLIQKFAAEIADLQLLGAFTDAAAAADFLKNNPVDLMISDINMPDVSGLDFVRELPDERPMIIFATAYREHAPDGFDLDVVDFLVKPLSVPRFEKAIQKAADLLALRQKAEKADAENLPAEPYFFVFSEYKEVKITVADILFIESMDDYVKIHVVGKKPVLTLERLKNLAERLEKRGFRRIHRSFLINLEKVEARQKSKILVGGAWLPIGEAFAETAAR